MVPRDPADRHEPYPLSDQTLAERLGIQFYTAWSLRFRIQDLLTVPEWEPLQQALLEGQADGMPLEAEQRRARIR